MLNPAQDSNGDPGRVDEHLPRDTFLLIQKWDPSGGDIELHKYASEKQEDIIQSRP